MAILNLCDLALIKAAEHRSKIETRHKMTCMMFPNDIFRNTASPARFSIHIRLWFECGSPFAVRVKIGRRSPEK